MSSTETKTIRHVEVLGLLLIFVQGTITFYELLQRYHSFFLGNAFTLYYQAFTYFGTGHFGFGPNYLGVPFLYLRGEFSFEALSLLGVISRSVLTLLALYVLFLFTCNWLIFSFAIAQLKNSTKSHEARFRLEFVVLVAILLDPFYYLLIVKEINFGWVMALMFGLLILRSQSSKRKGIRTIGIIGALATGLPGAIVLALVGIFRLTSSNGVKVLYAIIEVALAGASIIVLMVLGFDRGVTYSYFITTYSPSSLSVGSLGVLPSVSHLITSTKLLFGLLKSTSLQLAYLLLSGGLLGVASIAVLVGVIPVVLLWTAFQHTSLIDGAAFGFVASTFVILGTVRTIRVLSKFGNLSQSIASIVVIFAAAIMTFIVTVPNVIDHVWPVNSVNSFALKHVLASVPLDAQVIGDPRILGRFSNREWIFSDLIAGPIPVETPVVYFVFINSLPISANDVAPDTKFQFVKQLGAKLIYSSGTVSLFEWKSASSVALHF